jgi:prevent-host-death family protein
MDVDRNVTAVPASEARVHLGEMLRRVRKGEQIIIEKGGLPAAALIDVSDFEEYQRLKAARPRIAGPLSVLSSPAPDGRERLRRAVAIGWKGIDAEDLKRKIRESREVSTRPPVKF